MIRSNAWQPGCGFSTVDVLAVSVPFSLYSGWTTVASIANVAVAGAAAGWDGSFLSPSAWSAAMVVVAGGINLAVLWRRRDPVFPLVFVWAAISIHTNHPNDALVATTALVAAAVVAVTDVGACCFYYCCMVPKREA